MKKISLSVLVLLLGLPSQADLNPQHIPQDATCSVDFPDEENWAIIRNVRDLYGLNVVFPTDGLPGRTSITLRDQNWRAIFDEVLRPIGYAWKEEAGVIRVYDAFPEFRKKEAALDALSVSLRNAQRSSPPYGHHDWELHATIAVCSASLALNLFLLRATKRRANKPPEPMA